MTDRITLNGLRVFAHHGVHPTERDQGQVFFVDVTVEMDLLPAGTSDDLEDTVDYGALAARVEQIVADEQHQLIERVAERVAAEILGDPRIQGVEVTVHKPDAPMPVEVGDTAVTIRRSR